MHHQPEPVLHHRVHRVETHHRARGGAPRHIHLPERAVLMVARVRDRRRLRGDRGTFALWTVLFTIAAIFLTALLVDGGDAINAKERAADLAEQAARAAANDLVIT